MDTKSTIRRYDDAPHKCITARICVCAALATTALAAPAAAQQAAPPAISLNQYQQPEPGDAFMAVPSPSVGGHLVPAGRITFDYAKDPLVIIDQNDNVVASPVTDQAYLHVGASLALWDRLLIGVAMPIAVLQEGEASTGTSLAPASGAGAGDLRVGVRGRIFGEYYDPFQLGVTGWVFFPTGDDGNYSGEGSVYGLPMLNLGGRLPYFVYSAAAGAYVRGSDNPSQFYYSAAAGVLLVDDTLQIGPELYGAVAFEEKPFQTDIGPLNRRGSVNAELIGSVRYRFLDDFVVGAGAGSGIAEAVGTPQLRVLGSFAFAPEPDREQAPSDRDNDGIIDPDDACPDTPGVADPDPKKNGCPPDSDGDGILDADDACPDVPGVANDDPAKHGCPPPGDRDGDGIIDPEDACPDVPGVKSDDPKKNGCPADRDGDGIIDPEDACPDQPGVKHSDPKKNGCPRVQVTEQQIVILQKVEFEFDKAVIQPGSFGLLDEVAKILNEHPEIAQLEVQGHTDNLGNPAYNKNLSQERAKAVMKALTDRGVDGKRLTARGYGEEKPIATNDTDEGRATNRRVQFQILKRETKTE